MNDRSQLGQTTLFDLHPEGTEPPPSQRTITPGCLLPLAANQEIDATRAGSILDVSVTTVWKLYGLGRLRGYRISESRPLRIEYASVIEFCDQLRLEYHLHDRRPKLAAGRRWRDEDLLPFPKHDNATVGDAMTGLDMAKKKVLNLCEEGAFECYRLLPGAGVPWRISKTSLFAYRDRLAAQLRRPR